MKHERCEHPLRGSRSSCFVFVVFFPRGLSCSNTTKKLTYLFFSQVSEGDIVTMCSATFGDEMWSTRGVGLTRVLAAIRVRAGGTVKLALESTTEGKKKAALTQKQQDAAADARRAAQQKKDSLLKELEQDEVKLKKGKFLGLF